jgi:hypothetical protein
MLVYKPNKMECETSENSQANLLKQVYNKSVHLLPLN